MIMETAAYNKTVAWTPAADSYNTEFELDPTDKIGLEMNSAMIYGKVWHFD